MNPQLQAARDRLIEVNNRYKRLLSHTGSLLEKEPLGVPKRTPDGLTEAQWAFSLGECETESALLRQTIEDLLA